MVGIEVVGIESADPRWLRGSIDVLVERAYRLRAFGAIAPSLCQVAAGRFDALVSLRGCRAVDAAAAQLIVREAGGLISFPRFEHRLEAPLDLVPHSPDRGRAHGGDARRAGGGMPAPVIDWIVAEWIAARIAGEGRAPLPQIDLAPIVADAQERVVAYTGLVPAGPLPPAGRRQPPRVGGSEHLLDPGVDRADARAADRAPRTGQAGG